MQLNGASHHRNNIAAVRMLVAFVGSLAMAGGAAAQSSPLSDPGFDGASGFVDPAWRGTENTELLLDRHDPESGEASLRVSPRREERQAFAAASQSIPAEEYEGRVVRFRAAARVLPGSEGAGLWLRVDRREGGSSFFDNMRDRPITDPNWRFYEIVAPVLSGSQQIVLGVLVQSGAVWIDSSSIEDLGPIGAGNAHPAPLTHRSRENLEAFSLLYGYVRWFHPTPDEIDWNSVALAGVERVESARDAGELSERLSELFAPLAPTLRVSSVGIPEAPERRGIGELVRWSHRGVGVQPSTIYRSELIIADAHEDFTAELPGGVAIRLPLTTPRPGDGWDPSLFDLGRPPSYRPSGEDRTTRLAAVVVGWAALQQFYPYFDVVGDEWREALPSALEEAAVASSEAMFIRTLERLTVPLVDGHAMIGPQDRAGGLPFQWDWIEGRLVITQDVESLGLAAGDVVLSIDGQPANSAVEAQASLTSGSRQWQLHRALERLRTGAIGSTVTLEVETAQAGLRHITIPLVRRGPDDGLREPRPAVIAALGDGIVYLDLTRASAADLTELDLSNARAAVIDLRGYPGRVPPRWLAALVDRQLTTAPLQIEIAVRPDRTGDGRTVDDVAWDLPRGQTHFGGPLVFLTDARAISYAETLLGMVEAYDLGTIIGAPTAGANGDVNTIILPGGFSLRWTGLEVTRHGGERLHGLGIPPDIPVGRTVEGVRQRRDEALDAALAWLAERLSHPAQDISAEGRR